MENQFDDSKDNSAATSFLSVIGRTGTNRLKLELMDDAKDKADSLKFDINHILTKKFLECKTKSKYILKCMLLWHIAHLKTLIFKLRHNIL
jgi:hypothetical protein